MSHLIRGVGHRFTVADVRPQWLAFIQAVFTLYVRPALKGDLACPEFSLAPLTEVHGVPYGNGSVKEPRTITPVEIIDMALTGMPGSLAGFRGEAAKAFQKREPRNRMAAASIAAGPLLSNIRFPPLLSFDETFCPGSERHISSQFEFHFHFLRWFELAQLTSAYRTGLVFEDLVALAKYGPPGPSRHALFHAIAIDDMMLSLRWVRERIRLARANSDRSFFKELNKSLGSPSIPRTCRALILDLTLCIYQEWLAELSLAEQAALLMKCGISVTEKGLRNRRSRLQLTNAKGAAKRWPDLELTRESKSILDKVARMKTPADGVDLLLSVYPPSLQPFIRKVIALNPRLISDPRPQ